MMVATIVTQISWIIQIIFKLLNVTTNNLAYLGYDCNKVIVQATALGAFLSGLECVEVAFSFDSEVF